MRRDTLTSLGATVCATAMLTLAACGGGGGGGGGGGPVVLSSPILSLTSSCP